jgi:hypothetical protein
MIDGQAIEKYLQVITPESLKSGLPDDAVELEEAVGEDAEGEDVNFLIVRRAFRKLGKSSPRILKMC